MDSRTIRMSLTIMVALAVAVTRADGELIEYTFSGTVTSVEGAGAGIWSDVAANDTYVVTAIVDMDAEDVNPNASVGQFRTESYVVTIGDVSDGFDDASIWVRDGFDDNFAGTGEYYDELDGLWRAELYLSDPTATAFDMPELPLELSLDAFSTQWFTLERLTELLTGPTGDPFLLTATVETVSIQVIPAAGSLPVLLFGLLCRRGRRRSG